MKIPGGGWLPSNAAGMPIGPGREWSSPPGRWSRGERSGRGCRRGATRADAAIAETVVLIVCVELEFATGAGARIRLPDSRGWLPKERFRGSSYDWPIRARETINLQKP